MLARKVPAGPVMVALALAGATACAPIARAAGDGRTGIPAPSAQSAEAERGSGVLQGDGDIVRAPRGLDAVRVDALTRAITDQVNQARRRSGRQALLPDKRLDHVARSCAREPASRGRLDRSPTPA